MTHDYFAQFKDLQSFENSISTQECFKHFDKDLDGLLDRDEFNNLLNSLFSFNGKPYYIPKTRVNEFFDYFDTNKNEKIEFDEFTQFWQKTVRASLFSKSALVLVDIQNDFIDGSLALKHCSAKEDANDIIQVSNDLINNVPFDVCVYTQDWHPNDHISFYENLNLRKLSEKSPKLRDIQLYDTVVFENEAGEPIEQRLWPTHCVQNTHGSDFHPQLTKIENQQRFLLIQKGCDSHIDSYSAFFDNCKKHKTNLDNQLRAHGITDLYLCGLATDVCVAATAYDGLDLNYRIVLIEDACRGVDSIAISETKRNLIQKGAIVLNSRQVHRMVTHDDRRPELGYATLK